MSNPDPPLAEHHKLLLAAAGFVAGVAVVVWAGAVVAAVISGHSPSPLTFAGAVTALAGLPGHLAGPADAWPTNARRALPGPFVYWPALSAVAAGAALAVRAGWGMWDKRTGHALGIRPDAGFARSRDVAALRVAGPTAGRLTFGTVGRQLVAGEADASLAVIGPTGCGKTAGFAIPALLEWRGPVLATSVKSDLLDTTLKHRGAAGKVWVYDPTGSTGEPTASWSPIDACATWQDAQRTAAAMSDAARGDRDGVGDAEYWYTQARKALAPHLFAANAGHKTIADVVRWIDTQNRVEPDGLLLAPPTPDGTAAWHALLALRNKEARVRSSIYATVENVLAAYADPGVQAAAASAERRIGFGDWLDGDNTIYLIAPSHEQQRLRPVLTVLAQQAIRHAFEHANANGGRLPHPCLLLLDEAGNTAALPDLPAYAATARSHGITLVTIWQDISQITAIYGRRAHTVLNNHRARLFGRGIADSDTLDYLSRLIGDTRTTTRQHSTDPHGRTSTSEHHQYRRAAGLDALRRLPDNTAVLLYGAELPTPVRLRPWFKDRELKERVGKPAAGSL